MPGSDHNSVGAIPYVQKSTGSGADWGELGGYKTLSGDGSPSGAPIRPYAHVVSTIKFTGVPTVNGTIQITDNAGSPLAKTYTAKTSETVGSNQFANTNAEAAATSLKNCIDDSSGHNGSITVTRDGATLTLEDSGVGLSTNMVVTNMSNVTVTNTAWKEGNEGYVYTGSKWIRVTSGFNEFERDSNDVPATRTTPYESGWIHLVSIGDSDVSDAKAGNTNPAIVTGNNAVNTKTCTVSADSDIASDATITEIRVVLDMESAAVANSYDEMAIGSLRLTMPGSNNKVPLLPFLASSNNNIPPGDWLTNTNREVASRMFYGIKNGAITKRRFVFDSRAEAWGVPSLMHWMYNKNEGGPATPFRLSQSVLNSTTLPGFVYDTPSFPSTADVFSGEDENGVAFTDGRCASMFSFPYRTEQLAGETYENSYENLSYELKATDSGGYVAATGRDGLIGRDVVGTWGLEALRIFQGFYNIYFRCNVYVKVTS